MPHFCFCHILKSSGITEQAHRALQHGIYSLNSHYPGQLSRVSLFQAFSFWGQHKKMWKEKQRGLSRAKEGSLLSPPLPPYFFSPPLWLCAAFQILNAWNRLELNRPLHRFINTYPRTLNLQHWRNAVSLRYINRAEITVFMFELVVRFLCWRQIYPLYCEHSLTAVSSLLVMPTNPSINHAIFYSRLSNFLVRVNPKIRDKTLSLWSV